MEQARQKRVNRMIKESGLFKFKNLRALFRKMDENGNGYITSDEFEAFCKKQHLDTVVRRAEMWRAFVYADKDGDDAIDFPEFERTMKAINPMKQLHLTARRTDADRRRVRKRLPELQNLLKICWKRWNI